MQGSRFGRKRTESGPHTSHLPDRKSSYHIYPVTIRFSEWHCFLYISQKKKKKPTTINVINLRLINHKPFLFLTWKRATAQTQKQLKGKVRVFIRTECGTANKRASDPNQCLQLWCREMSHSIISVCFTTWNRFFVAVGRPWLIVLSA